MITGYSHSDRHNQQRTASWLRCQRAFAEGFARLQDPQLEDFSAHGLRAAKPGTRAFGLFPLLALVSALGVLLVSLSYDLSQYGSLALEGLFLPGLLLIYVPCLVRLLSPAPLRLERICLLCLVGMCFFLVQLMVSPLYISSYDAMLHWIRLGGKEEDYPKFLLPPPLQKNEHLPNANTELFEQDKEGNWYAMVGAIMEKRCVRCHSPNVGGPGSEIHLSHFTLPVLRRLLTTTGFDVRWVSIDDHYTMPNVKTNVQVALYRTVRRVTGANMRPGDGAGRGAS